MHKRAIPARPSVNKCWYKGKLEIELFEGVAWTLQFTKGPRRERVCQGAVVVVF